MTKPTRNLLSLPHLSSLGTPPPELVDAAAEAGFDAVGLRLRPVGRAGEAMGPLLVGTPLFNETRAALLATGLSMLDAEVVLVEPGLVAENYLAMFEAAAELGGKHIQVASLTDNEDLVTGVFEALADAANPFGLTLNLEFAAFLGVSSLASARRVVERAGRPNTGILLDALHVARSDTIAGQLAEPSMRPMLHYIQLCDAPASAPSRDRLRDEALFERLPPGEGHLDLLGMLSALPDDISISVEVPLSGPRANLPVRELAVLLHRATVTLLHKLAPSGEA